VRIHKDGTVWLEEGEPLPVVCRCGALYQPETHSECSDCPKCGRTNVHGLQEWRKVKQ
jgi:hypothetical protein